VSASLASTLHDKRLQASRQWLQARQARQRAAGSAPEPAAHPPPVDVRVESPKQGGGDETPSEADRAAAARRLLYEAEAEKIDVDLAARGVGRFRRRSDFARPPKNNTDRNFIDKVWRAAHMLERKTWACRKKGKHGGELGTVALEVFRTLLYVIKKDNGELYPSLVTIAKLSRKSKQAVVKAIKVLVRMGFISICRRVKRIQTPFGTRAVQDSNAYVYHLPRSGIGALAMAVFCYRPSESTKLDAYKHKHENREESSSSSTSGSVEKRLCREEVDRWWLVEPFQTGNGGWR
jgi:hypothetical protein